MDLPGWVGVRPSQQQAPLQSASVSNELGLVRPRAVIVSGHIPGPPSPHPVPASPFTSRAEQGGEVSALSPLHVLPPPWPVTVATSCSQSLPSPGAHDTCHAQPLPFSSAAAQSMFCCWTLNCGEADPVAEMEGKTQPQLLATILLSPPENQKSHDLPCSPEVLLW